MGMVIRHVDESRWERVYGQITTHGKTAPLSLQYDVYLDCNGTEYILKVQPESGRRLVALQALGVYLDGDIIGAKDYTLIEDGPMLSALLEIVIYQGAGKM